MVNQLACLDLLLGPLLDLSTCFMYLAALAGA